MEHRSSPFPSHPTVGTSNWTRTPIKPLGYEKYSLRGSHHFQRLPNTLAMMMECQNDNVFVKYLNEGADMLWWRRKVTIRMTVVLSFVFLLSV